VGTPGAVTLFPDTVWRYLNRAGLDQDGRAMGSVADAVLAEWRAGNRFGPPGSEEERERVALLFGPGGTYSLDDLEVREALIELLMAGVGLMQRDLRLLLAELQAQVPAEP
jgi:hypothetical protein